MRMIRILILAVVCTYGLRLMQPLTSFLTEHKQDPELVRAGEHLSQAAGEGVSWLGKQIADELISSPESDLLESDLPELCPSEPPINPTNFDTSR